MASRCRFGLYEFDQDTLELRREGVAVHLQGQPKQVLAYLIRNADRVVSREELRKAVWGEQTFVDFERGLNFCISQVRSALGDDASQPIYIRTMARQGYQFIAPLEYIAAESRPPAKPGRRSVPRLALAGVVLCAVSLLAGYLLHRTATPKPLPIVAVVRFDNETGNPGMTRFSDDMTDNFVERLTALGDGQYGVIGNARILRAPRNERDLNAIASTLRANFVVLGQVQALPGKTRILVHLIRMPDQTHVSVARMDVDRPFDAETGTAQAVATQFSQRLMALRASLQVAPSN